MNGASPIDLAFDFSFFGVLHRRIWVSPFGMVLFEEHRSAETSFRGVSHLRSAIVVAAGHYDLDRDGATVAVVPGATEIEVAWHAPLFENAVFSDVAVVLGADGSVVIKWERIDLSAGGSLGHGLVAELLLDSLGSLPADVVLQTTSNAASANIIMMVEDLANITVGPFYGGDVGEGLDLDGEFVCAVNVIGPPLQVRDVAFARREDAECVTLTYIPQVFGSDNQPLEGRGHQVYGMQSDTTPIFGSSADDAALMEIMTAGVWSESI
eukprot:COSAG04_NODE_10145_length_801_cov_0.733618_1_plen_266_part_11